MTTNRQNTISEHVPRHDPHAERAAVGACLLGQTERVLAKIGPEDIQDGEARLVLDAVAAVRRDGIPIDLMTVAGRLTTAFGVEPGQAETLVATISESIASGDPANVDFYLRRCLEGSALRRLGYILEEGQRRLEDGARPADLLRQLGEEVADLASGSGRAMPILEANDVAKTETGALRFLPFFGRDGYIVAGWSHILSGYPKSGKTELVTRLMADWPDERVLVLSEEPKGVWAARLKRIGGLPNVGIGFALGVGAAGMIDAMRGSDAAVFVVDTIRLLGIEDENDAACVALALAPVIKAARDKGATLVCLHHSRKGGGAHAEGVAGSHALVGIVDIVLELHRVENSPRRRLVRGLGRVIEVPDLLYEMDDVGGLVALGDPGLVAADALRDRILEALDDGEWLTMPELLDRLGEPKPSRRGVGNQLARLEEAARVERDPPGGGRGKAQKIRLAQLAVELAPITGLVPTELPLESPSAMNMPNRLPTCGEEVGLARTLLKVPTVPTSPADPETVPPPPATAPPRSARPACPRCGSALKVTGANHKAKVLLRSCPKCNPDAGEAAFRHRVAAIQAERHCTDEEAEDLALREELAAS